MEGEAATAAGIDFQDWELLANSDSDPPNSPKSLENSEVIEADSGGIIRLDYFSLENDNRFSKSNVVEEDSSVESDNPSWIDPASDVTRYQGRNSAEFWSDSGSDRSDDRKFIDSDTKNELGFVENTKAEVGFEGIGDLVANKGEFCGFERKNELNFEENVKSQMLIEGPEIEGERVGGNARGDEVVERKVGSVEQEKTKVVWWKVPFELLRYCVLRVGPVWSFSMAAAFMGFVILGRRMYKMKRKTQSLQLKVAVDDKKVSQVMSRAARLNEAFSVVRRVPIVRPLLPAAGVNPWPVMSLR